MIVKRDKLTLWERLYLPAILGGFKVTLRHFANTLFRGQTAQGGVDELMARELRAEQDA